MGRTKAGKAGLPLQNKPPGNDGCAHAPPGDDRVCLCLWSGQQEYRSLVLFSCRSGLPDGTTNGTHRSPVAKGERAIDLRIAGCRSSVEPGPNPKPAPLESTCTSELEGRDR